MYFLRTSFMALDERFTYSNRITLCVLGIFFYIKREDEEKP